MMNNDALSHAVRTSLIAMCLVALTAVGLSAPVGTADALPAQAPAPASAHARIDMAQVYASPELVPIYMDENTPEWAIGVLLGMGYHGDPNDGREAIYAPASVDVEDAPEWVAEALMELGYGSDSDDGAERLYAPIYTD
jgi:hypothetical protein